MERKGEGNLNSSLINWNAFFLEKEKKKKTKGKKRQYLFLKECVWAGGELCWEVPFRLQPGKARTCSQNGGEGVAMACLTNKDMSKEPFATLAWAQFKRERKKKKSGREEK